MSIGLLFWIIMLIGFIFWGWVTWTPNAPYAPLPSDHLVDPDRAPWLGACLVLRSIR